MRFSLLALTLTFFWSCAEKDATPPPAPVVDPLESPTPRLKISVTGSAEFGATVKLAGGAAEVTTTADTFTARWRAEIELKKDVENTLSVTATDAAGNASEATVVKVNQSSPQASNIKLSLTAPVARAGELVGLIAVVFDQYGNEMPDAVVSFESTPALAATFTIPGSMPAVTKAQGVLAGTRQFVAFDLSAVKSADFVFQLKATSGTVSDTLPLTVRPASGHSFSKLAWVPLGTQLTIVAGQDASYTYEVVDLYGNVTTGPVSAFTSAPGAVVVEDGVSGAGKLTRATTAGNSTLAFYLAGVGQKGSLNLSVGTAPAAFVELVASATLTSPQSPVRLFARVRDVFGNPIECTPATAGDLSFTTTGTTTTGPTPGATSCFNGAFQASVTFSAEDNFAITATHQPTGATATSSSVFITVLNFDNTPPQVSIANITVNGNPCTPASRPVATGCDVSSGDSVDFDVRATDNSALAQLAYNIFFESTQSVRTRTVFVAANQASATIRFRFTVNSNAIETSPLVAMALDRAGNIQNSAAVNFYVNTGVALGGRVLSTAVASPLLNRPADLAFDSTGALFIINRGNNQLLKVPSGGTAQVAAANVLGEFLVRAPSGSGERLFLSDRSVNGVVLSFDPAAPGPLQTWTNFGAGTARGLAVLSALPARGWVDASGATDGDRLTFTQNGVALTYELDSNASCVATPTLFCAPFTAAGATGAIRAAALVTAINNNPSSPVAASVVTGNAGRLNIFTKLAGEPTGANTVSIGVTAGLGRSATTLAEGHDADLWVANDGDNSVRRFFTTGTPPVTHGAFNVGAPQFGLAVRDGWSTTNDRLFDAVEYFVDDGNNNQLIAARSTVTAAGGVLFPFTSQVFTLTNGGFNALWDVQLLPNGCLLVSDDGNGDLFAIDTTNPANTAPTVERIARGLPGPRGLTIDPAGNLLIAVDQGNAVLRLTPSPAANDCF
ncbi:MAG: Ig-like domain-containing protein [Archangium sp.]|nr:Ig-like domain-containing protein [Archangium sp.]MDP3153659.1 Ig-like domain-containing protein [Archangium sp.]MDP3569293.1 Ig-like domain-containing protein [Archangium sp.]